MKIIICLKTVKHIINLQHYLVSEINKNSYTINFKSFLVSLQSFTKKFIFIYCIININELST
jgi:hypothetical protein